MNWALLTFVGVGGGLGVVYLFNLLFNRLFPLHTHSVAPQPISVPPAQGQLHRPGVAVLARVVMFAVVLVYVPVLAVSVLIAVGATAAWGIPGLLLGVLLAGMLICCFAWFVVRLVTGKSRIVSAPMPRGR